MSSKVDAMRAMREARYAEMQKTSAPQKVAKPKVSREQGEPNKAVELPSEGLCDHRAGVSGKACTRPLNHAEKNHRYK